MIRRSAPAAAASAATYSMPGVSTTGSSSLGTAFVVGRKRVPRPAAGTIAVRKARVELMVASVVPHLGLPPMTSDQLERKSAERERLMAARRAVPLAERGH